MIIVPDIIQGTPEWFEKKAGVPSASNFHKILTPTGKLSEQRHDYLYQLAGEAILGRSEEGYQNAAMQAGIEREAESRLCFELLTGLVVRQVGMVFTDDLKALCSPDGLLDYAGLELKNPLAKTHAKYLLKGDLPSDYFCQVQGSMYVTGFKHWHFMSYYPGMPLFLLDVQRDEAWIEQLAGALKTFCADLERAVEKLRGM